MKNILLIFFTICLMSSCHQTQNESLRSAEKDSLLQVIDNLRNKIKSPSNTSTPLLSLKHNFVFSEIVYARYLTSNPEIQKDFVNLGEIEEINDFINEEFKYKYLDNKEEDVRHRFNFSNGVSWKIISRELLTFSTYKEASLYQSKIRNQQSPQFSD